MNGTLNFGEILLRVLAAAAAGALVGLERETHGRPAGLRTTILVCVASAIAMVTSELLFMESAGAATNWRPDPARLGAGILTGIGFLGAGTILQHRNSVHGLTTAASLWFATVLGLALGAGEFAIGALGVVIALATLLALPCVERRLPSDQFSVLTVVTQLDAVEENVVRERLDALGVQVLRMDLACDIAARQKTISYELKLDKRTAVERSVQVMESLRQCPGVLHLKWT